MLKKSLMAATALEMATMMNKSPPIDQEKIPSDKNSQTALFTVWLWPYNAVFPPENEREKRLVIHSVLLPERLTRARLAPSALSLIHI